MLLYYVIERQVEGVSTCILNHFESVVRDFEHGGDHHHHCLKTIIRSFILYCLVNNSQCFMLRRSYETSGRLMPSQCFHKYHLEFGTTSEIRWRMLRNKSGRRMASHSSEHERVRLTLKSKHGRRMASHVYENYTIIKYVNDSLTRMAGASLCVFRNSMYELHDWAIES